MTLRALRIDYISPAVCELAVSSSGSGSGDSATLDLVPVSRRDGPAILQASVNGPTVTLSWSEQSYIYAYVVYAAFSPDGPFTMITSNVIDNTFSYNPGAGTYYFKVTGIEPDAGETLPSPTTGPTTVL